MTTLTLDTDAVTIVRAIIAGHVTRSAIATATGLTPSVIHTRMHQLRDAGAIDWIDGCAGTVHARVTEEDVPQMPKPRRKESA